MLVDRLNWDVYPYQVYRFWVPAFPALFAVSVAVLSRRPALLVAAFIAVIAGFMWVPAPTFLGPTVQPWMLLVPLTFLAGLGVAWTMKSLGLDRPWLLRAGALALALAFLALAGSGLRGWEGRREGALGTWEYAAGWSHLPCAKGGVTVAYTGANLPYALHGPGLMNRVVYVDTAGRLMPEDHRVWKELDGRRPEFRTPEPIVSGLELCPRAWAETMTDSRIDYLVVMKVMRNALLDEVHDEQGWLIEDSWARQVPDVFVPVYADQATRIYAINPRVGEAVKVLPETCATRPPDAPTAMNSPNGVWEKYFPLALEAMKEMSISF